MRKLAFIILACALPSGLCAQQVKLLNTVLPEAHAASTAPVPGGTAGIAEPAKAAAAAPVIQTAEIIPVISQSAPAVKRPAVVKDIPVAGEKRAALKPAPAQRKASSGASPSGPGKEAASLKFIPSELVREAELPHGAIKAGGFLVGKMHKVNTGDTLWDLSGRYYKDPFLWGRIYNANYNTVADPDRIYPKEELIIPDLTEIVLPYRRVGTAAAAQAEVTAPQGLDASGVSGGYARPAAGKTALPEPGEALAVFDRDFVSEEMPEDLKEWSDNIKIVPDSWSEDGEITAKLKGEDGSLDDSFSVTGEVVEILMVRSGAAKPGDYLAVYLKGGDAYSRSGKRLGRELQLAGLAEVLVVDDLTVKARVIDATTAISRGYIVKKK